MKTQKQKTISPETIQALKAGDQYALEIIFEAFYDRLYHFVFSYTKCAYSSKEVVQNVFIKVWKKRASIRPQTFGTYMFTIARNLAYNHMRDAMRRENKERLWSEITSRVSDETETYLLKKEFQSAIERVVHHLPPQKKTIYYLSWKEGKSKEEIARKLNITQKTVKNHLWAIKNTIKENLGPYLEKPIC